MILFLVYFFIRREIFLKLGLISLIIVMTAPSLFRPFSIFWMKFSEAIGTVMNRFILSLVFFLVVTPVALIMKSCGYDPLMKNQWKKGDNSVFRTRCGNAVSEHLTKPF